MFELIKKTMLTGIGLAAMTKTEVEERVAELTEKGEISEKEGKALLDELLKRSQQARGDLEAAAEEIVSKVLARMDLATKGDVDRLAESIKSLERKEQARKGPGVS